MKEEYWLERRKFNYYQAAFNFCQRYGSSAQSVLDVGAANTQFIQWLDWIPKRTALDLVPPPPLENIQTIGGDFLSWRPTNYYDLLTCLQVLEHLEYPDYFARKLLYIGRTVVVSVPFNWPRHECQWHRQDPVDLRKLESWFGVPALDSEIVEDLGMQRLIAVFHDS